MKASGRKAGKQRGDDGHPPTAAADDRPRAAVAIYETSQGKLRLQPFCTCLIVISRVLKGLHSDELRALGVAKALHHCTMCAFAEL